MEVHSFFLTLKCPESVYKRSYTLLEGRSWPGANIMLYRCFVLVFISKLGIYYQLFSAPLRVLGDTLWRLPDLVSGPETEYQAAETLEGGALVRPKFLSNLYSKCVTTDS